VPAQPPAGPQGPQASPQPGWRGAWGEGTRRLRSAAATEPGKLRIIGAALALLVIVFGAVASWESADRFTAADDVVEHSRPLSEESANIYNYLAGADAAAASGFLAGTQDPPEVLADYWTDIEGASDLVAKAAGDAGSSSRSSADISVLSVGIPRYTGLVERARANNREGKQVGGAYLQYANELMSEKLLPAAERFYTAETQQLGKDNDDARLWPFVSLFVGVLAVGGLLWAQRREYRRTNRVINQGMALATATSVVLLAWLAVGHTVAQVRLGDAKQHSQASLANLNDARIDSFKARTNENLKMVARGAVPSDDAEKDTRDDARSPRFTDRYEREFTTDMADLSETLEQEKALAGSKRVDAAITSVAQWKQRHTEAAGLDTAGNYEDALQKIIGTKRTTDPSFDQTGTTGQSFGQVDDDLRLAIVGETTEFKNLADKGRGALEPLEFGAIGLALVGAAGAALGMGRRLSEYR
jgi:hypothetical protein